MIVSVIEFKSDKTWGGKALQISSFSGLTVCEEVGGAFSLSADWEDEAVFWLEALPGCEANLVNVRMTRCGEGVGCEGGIIGIGKSLYAI